MQPLKWGYKFSREIARRMPHFSGEPLAHHPTFAPGSSASIVTHAEGPVPFDTPRIVYSDDDERALEEFARANGAWLLPFPFSFDLYNTHFIYFYRTDGSVPVGALGELLSPLRCPASSKTRIACTPGLTLFFALARHLCDEAA
jgi:hypothetical protein